MMKPYLSRAALGVLGTLGSVAVGVALPGLWPAAGGRDFGPRGANAAVLLVILAFILRRNLLWRAGDFLLTVVLVGVLSLAIIGRFSGTQGFNYFNLHWLGFINLFIGLPCLGGFALAALWPKS